jgi:hypothetical protein
MLGIQTTYTDSTEHNGGRTDSTIHGTTTDSVVDESREGDEGIWCNMRTSKKRRKKQSRVIPAGESNVNQ